MGVGAGLYMYDVVVQTFTFAISSTEEYLYGTCISPSLLLVMSRNGVFSVCSSGLFFILPCTDYYTKVDLRTVSFDVPPQEVRLDVCEQQFYRMAQKPAY